MNKPNIILDKVTNHAPLRLQLSEQTKLIPINFENGGRGLIDTGDPLAGSWIAMIDYLRENDRLVYAETEKEVITNVFVPEVAKVIDIDDTGAGEVEVSFSTVSALHRLRRDHPDFQQLLETLKAAKDNNSEVLVTATFYHAEIVDVRTAPAFLIKEAEQVPPAIRVVPKPVTQERAKELFKMIEAETFTPCYSTRDCIPFKYPPDGCWIRAHLMCYMLIGQKEFPAKIWSSGRLQARSSNVPECRVAWSWHVAATLLVRYEDGREVNMVLDPSLYEEPVTEEKWKALQTDPNAKLNRTVWEQYNFYGGTATWETANTDMGKYRIYLDQLCSQYGPSPYHCPL